MAAGNRAYGFSVRCVQHLPDCLLINVLLYRRAALGLDRLRLCNPQINLGLLSPCTIFVHPKTKNNDCQKSIPACNCAAYSRPSPQDMGQDPHAPRRSDYRLPRLVPTPLYRKQRSGIRHAHSVGRRLRLGQTAAGHFPRRTGGRHRMADRPAAPPTQRNAVRGDRRSGADFRRSGGQHSRQRILRTAVLRIDALFGCPFRRPLRRVHDGKSRRHVLFPAVPMEQRTAIPAVPGRQQQLFLRSHFQSGRCVHFCGGSLLAVIPIQVPRQAVTSQGRIHIAFPATEVRLIENGLINNSTANNIFFFRFFGSSEKSAIFALRKSYMPRWRNR